MTMRPLSEAARRIPSASLLLSALAVIAYFAPAPVEVLQYDRLALQRGELWRLLTCHWTHWSLNHLLWDLAVFAGLGSVCEQMNRRRYLLCLAASTVLIPVFVFLFLPQVGIYRGLSGLDSALFSLLAVTVLLEKFEERRWGWVSLGVGFLLAFLAKTAYETTTGGTVFVSSLPGVTAVPLAHAVGVAVGAVMAFGWRRQTTLRSESAWQEMTVNHVGMDR